MRSDASQEACGNAPLQVGTSDRRTYADAVTRGRHRSPWRVPLLYDAASSLTSLKARTIEFASAFPPSPATAPQISGAGFVPEASEEPGQ